MAEDLELPFADTGSTITLTVQQALPEGVEPPDPEPEERPLAQADPAQRAAVGVDEQGRAEPVGKAVRLPAERLPRPGFEEGRCSMWR